MFILNGECRLKISHILFILGRWSALSSLRLHEDFSSHFSYLDMMNVEIW